MFHKCFYWIIHLFRQIIHDCDDVQYCPCPYLPDELIVNILSRLPKEALIQCRKVCKKWWMLTSSSQFIELHQTMVKPLTLLHLVDNYCYLKLFIVDDKGRKKEYNLGVLKKLTSINYVSSCNGLVLLSSRKHFDKYHVLNPLSAQGRITTIDASDWNIGFACGFFFHPLAKEYRILSWRKVYTGYEYFLYLFGAKMWRRTVNPYFQYQPLNYRDLAIVNGFLHWYIGGNEIMLFNMITEEFFTGLTPVTESSYKMRNLLVKEDRLCFFNVGSQRRVMDIWIMEDYHNGSWAKKYVVDLDWDVIKYPMKGDHIGGEVALNYVNVVSIHKNELMLFWKHRGLFSYHLGYNTVKKINVKVELDGYNIDDHYGWLWGFRAFK